MEKKDGNKEKRYELGKKGVIWKGFIKYLKVKCDL